ncbi:MAG TPA: Smr/MutS family protein [Candidatus Acidoferrales bacterium]|nr:Smr/MutS family protein [Candidatus Acidoferrales bacterium]
MSRPAEEILEFARLREILLGYTTCAPGRRAIQALAFTEDRVALEGAFASLAEAAAWLRAGSDLGFGALADPEPWLARLAVRVNVLLPAELLDSASLADATADLKATMRHEGERFPRLAGRAATLPDLGSLSTAVRRAILPNGEVSDDASPELRRIRSALVKEREKIQEHLRRILRARGEQPGEDYVTLRNDRYVIPVRAADRRAVPGVMHGASGTGQTVFIEPLDTLDANNHLVQLAEDEAAEIARILVDLTARLRSAFPQLEGAAATIAQLDSLFSRARFSREFTCTLPAFSDEQRLSLVAARHPVLEAKLRAEGRAVIPMSLELGGAETVLVISGPNTGGKTVILKTVGLAVLSAQSGIPVAAERAELPVVDRVLADIGDEQSIAADLSTFSAHMLNLRGMLEAAGPRSLTLLDEIGTGTAPEEGSALAIALLEEFRARGCITLATTHHDRLKTYASTTPGVVNAAVEFDGKNLRPTYRLLLGVPGVSSGIAIARRLGLPESALERAEREMSPEAREAGALIAYLHRSREELDESKRRAVAELGALESERTALRTEWTERQRRRIAELEARMDQTVKRYEADMARVLGGIRDTELRAQAEKAGRRQSQKARSEARDEADAAVVAQLSDSQQDLGTTAVREQPVAANLLVPGVRVRVRGLPKPVLLRQIDDRSAQVEAGPLRMKVKRDDILAVVSDAPASAQSSKATATARPSVRVHTHAAQADAPEEINVIGCTVEEASERVDKFLDEAALAGKPRVRIIHGHGTGALRRGLAEFLAAHPHVQSTSAEEPERGGDAVTVAEMKL